MFDLCRFLSWFRLFHWRKQYYGLQTHILATFQIKIILMLDLFLTNTHLFASRDINWWTGVVWINVMCLSDSHCDGTHSLQSIHWLSFWRHPFTAEHPLTLILTAPIHCRASIDSHSDGTHSLQSIHCWDTDVMLHFSKSDGDTNSFTSWMTRGWVHFIFGWTKSIFILYAICGSWIIQVLLL